MTIIVDGVPVSGSKGHTTTSRNRAGAYTRNRTKPINPNSVAQQNARMYFRAAIDEWTNVLTDLERASWSIYAASVPWLNAAGQAMFMTGQNAYVRASTVYQQAGGTAPATAPAIFDLGSLQIFPTTLTYDTSANTLAFAASAPLASNSWQDVDGFCLFSIYAPSNPSRAFRPNLKRLWRVFDAGAVPASPITVTAFTSPYVFQTGQKAWISARGVAPDGRVTVEQLLNPVIITVVP